MIRSCWCSLLDSRDSALTPASWKTLRQTYVIFGRISRAARWRSPVEPARASFNPICPGFDSAGLGT
jgi:hypothetical protein